MIFRHFIWFLNPWNHAWFEACFLLSDCNEVAPNPKLFFLQLSFSCSPAQSLSQAGQSQAEDFSSKHDLYMEEVKWLSYQDKTEQQNEGILATKTEKES